MRTLMKLFCIFAVICVASFIWFSAGANKMKGFCEKIAIGSSIDELKVSVASNGFKFSDSHMETPGYLLIHDKATMGRFL